MLQKLRPIIVPDNELAKGRRGVGRTAAIRMSRSQNPGLWLSMDSNLN